MPHEAAPQPELGDLLNELRAIRAAVEAGEPELVDAAGVGRLLSVSRSHVHTLNAQGLLPEPVVVGCGTAVRWNVREIRVWCAAGCPSRPLWKVQRQQAMRRAG